MHQRKLINLYCKRLIDNVQNCNTIETISSTTFLYIKNQQLSEITLAFLRPAFSQIKTIKIFSIIGHENI